MNKIKFIALLSIFCFIFLIPCANALDNQTVTWENDTGVLTKEYYFDADIGNDTGDGTVNSPYKTLSSQTIKDNSIIHLSEGQYNLTSKISVRNVTIIGQNPSNTIISYSGVGFNVKTSLVLKGISLNNLSIENQGNITAKNVIFKNGYNSEGGAIKSNQYSDTRIDLDNCTFSDNHANYGGAINVNKCIININNCVFINNYAQMYGGAIACSENVNITIKKSKFISDYSQKDAGGALYLFTTQNTVCENVEVINCTSNFGGAITSVNSNVNLTRLNAVNNTARYYGGAIYSIYGVLRLNQSTFYSNNAQIGGALYIDEVYDFIPYYNTFADNTATDYANSVYSSISEDLLPNSVLESVFHNTVDKNDVYESYLPDLNIGSNDYLMIKYQDTFNGTIPSQYDLRELNQVTPVKNQGNNGNCWAFSSLAALESCILKATGVAYDLSEENMKNLMAMYSDYGWAMEPNKGGYDKMGVGYLTGWLGPVNESDDEYYTNGVLSPVLDSLIHIQNILYLTRTDYTDNDAIKMAIMQYGAVSTSVYWSSSYAKGKNYYYDGTSGANHAVAIVGWDDNYSKTNFKSTPEGDGAWIIKNSWGSSSGDKGYYYVSYYDTRLAPLNKSESTFTFVLNDTQRFDKNYQYDIAGKTDYFLNTTSTVWYKNMFVASSNEYLKAVSTYFKDQTSWVLSVYVNNVLKLTKSGKSSPSYSTIDLGKSIPLKIGDVFEIEFKITVDGDAGIPISERISLNREIYIENISYISYDGVNWIDFYELTWSYPDHTYNSQVACIKAFTVINTKDNSTEIESLNLTVIAEDSEIYLNNNYRYSVKLVDSSNNPLIDKKVTFTVGDMTFNTNTNRKGIATLNYRFGVGEYSIGVFSPEEGKYLSASASANLKVKSTIILSSDKVYTYNSRYYATVVDFDAKPYVGQEITLSFGSNVYSLYTDSEGKIYYDIDLSPGNYVAVVTNVEFDDVATQNIQVVSRISENSDLKMYYGSAKYYTVKVLNDYGKVEKGLKVTFNINGKDYTGYTDANGYASIQITQNPNTYTITATYKGFSVKNKIVVKPTIITKDMTVKKGKNIKFKIKLINSNGKILKNKKVKVKFKGKTYKVKTNSKGKATLKITKKYGVGKYKIKTVYGAAKVTNIITIK